MDDAYAYCAQQVRQLDKDRYLASLFAGEAARPHVMAILAFSAEIARVRDVVSDPLPGEVRLQWWRDLLDASPAAPGSPAETARSPAFAVTGHPVAMALTATIARFKLPVTAFTNLIDARIFDLYDDPMPDIHGLEGYCGETASALIQLAAIVLAGGDDPGTAEAAGHAGVAYGLTGLMRSVAFHAHRGQIYLPLDLMRQHGAAPEDLLAGRATPQLRSVLADLRRRARDHLQTSRTLASAIAREVRPAFLACALIEPMLDRMDRRGYDPFRDVIDMPQWQKQLRLWWAARGSR